MFRTFHPLQLIIASLALALAGIGAPAARAWSATRASVTRLAMDGEPAAPDHCTAGPEYIAAGIYALVEWRDNSDNEDGFTIEWWAKANGKWVLVATDDVSANETGATLWATLGGDRYRVRAFNAYGVSAWSDWANLRVH